MQNVNRKLVKGNLVKRKQNDGNRQKSPLPFNNQKDTMSQTSEQSPVFFVSTISMKPLRLFGNKKYVEYMLPSCGNSLDGLVYSSRTWLWLPTYEEAELFVLENRTDIAEGATNQWAVIEGIRPIFADLYPEPQVFFEFVGNWEKDGHYVKLDRWPEAVDKYYSDHYLVRSVTTIG